MESSSYFISFVSPDNNLKVVLHIHNISNNRWLPKACCVLKVSQLEILLRAPILLHSPYSHVWRLVSYL